MLARQTDFSITCVRPDSTQLFFLFVGIWNTLTINTIDFLRATAIGDRNIVLVKDPHVWHCYQRGVSDDYDSLDGIVRWQRALMATEFPHVRDVFCAGASAGGGPAIHTACRLGARAAWSLGGRIVHAEVAEQRDHVARSLYQRVLGRPSPQGLSAEEHEQLLAALAEPAMRQLRRDLTGNPATLVARDRVEGLARLVRESDGPTAYHFYYATTNAIDRQFADAFRGCRTARFHPVTPPPTDWSRDVTFRDPDHGIVPMLHELGQLGTVFAPYL